jgi:hypothetical protein
MEDTEKPYMDKYKEIMNDWNYNANCMLTLIPIWDLNFKLLFFVVQNVPILDVLLGLKFAIKLKRTTMYPTNIANDLVVH